MGGTHRTARLNNLEELFYISCFSSLSRSEYSKRLAVWTDKESLPGQILISHSGPFLSVDFWDGGMQAQGYKEVKTWLRRSCAF